ncbi:hypothetical protein D3C72_1721040 [compost metagenome]
MAHQLGLHVDAARHAIGAQLHHLQPQHLVEHNFFFEYQLEPRNESRLKRVRRGGGGLAHGSPGGWVRGSAWSLRYPNTPYFVATSALWISARGHFYLKIAIVN